MHKAWLLNFYILTLFAGIVPFQLAAQNCLEKRITVEASNRSLGHVLELISHQGNFYFSYNSSLLRPDSLVSLSMTDKPVRLVLDALFKNRFQYKENNNYVILRPVPVQTTVVARRQPSAENMYVVSGYVINGETGNRVSNASVYEKERLVSSLSDGNGYFVVRLKSKYARAALTISKDAYEDTTVIIEPRVNQLINIAILPSLPVNSLVTISPVDYERPDSVATILGADSLTHLPVPVLNLVEKTRWGKLFLSAQQQMQSINLKKFFATRTFQVSLIPKVGTHGGLSGQVTNKLSFNLLGGYAGGVEGVELGGLFNIDKKSVQYLQAAGLFNIVGGSMKGVQLAGIHNMVLDTAYGLQAGGISNIVKRQYTGVQLAGIHNYTGARFSGVQAAGINNFTGGAFAGFQLAGINNTAGDSLTGAQLAGIINVASRAVKGLQMSGLINVGLREVKGMQLTGIINYAKKLKGLQIGLVNIADTSAGYSIGLVNIVLKGYHKLSVSTNEVSDIALTFRSGNSKLYTIWQAGFKQRDTVKNRSFGYGLGHAFTITRQFTINPELTMEHFLAEQWEKANLVSKLYLQFNYQIGKWFTVFAGPSLAIHYTTGNTSSLKDLPQAGYHTFSIGHGNTEGWIGWNAGITFF